MGVGPLFGLHLTSGLCHLRGLTTWGDALFLALQHIALDHLLYIGEFGLLCLIAGSRVLLGHSGSLELFAKCSWIARGIVFAAVLAAITRASANFLPKIMISHYESAAS